MLESIICKPIVPALGRLRQEDYKLKARLAYKVSLRPVCVRLSQKANTYKNTHTQTHKSKLQVGKLLTLQTSPFYFK